MQVAGVTVVQEALPGDAGIQQTTPASPVTHEALDPQDACRTEP